MPSLFSLNAKGSSIGKDSLFMNCREIARLIDMFEKTIRCVFGCSNDDKVKLGFYLVDKSCRDDSRKIRSF